MKTSNLTKKIRFKFLAIIFSIIIFFLITGITIYIQSTRIIEDYVNETIESELTNCRNNIDSRMREINNTINQINYNPSIAELSELSNPVKTSENAFLFRKYIEEKTKNSSVNDFIEDIHINLNNSSCVLTDDKVYLNRTLFYESIFKNTSQEEISRYKQLSTINLYYRYEHLFKNLTLNNIKGNRLAIINSLYINNQVKGTIFVFVNENKILNQLALLDKYEESNIFIFKKNGSLLLSSSDDAIFAGKDQDEIVNYLKNNNNIIIKSSSEFNSWSYIAAIPNRVAMKKISTLRYVALIMILISILSSLWIIYKIIFKRIVLVEETLSLIKKNKGEDSLIRDSFDFLKESVSSIILDNSVMKDKISEYQIIYQSDFYRQLLEGSFYDEENMKQHKPDNLAPVENKLYQSVILFSIDHDDNQISANSINDMHKIKILVTSYLEEYVQEKIYICDVRVNTLALIISFEDISLIKDKLNKVYLDLSSIIRNQFKKDLYATMGSVQNRLYDIRIAYWEAKEILENNIHTLDKILMFDDIDYVSTACYYPIEVEKKLMNKVQASDEKGAKLILKDVIDKNLCYNQNNPYLTKQLIYNITGTLLNLYMKISTTSKQTDESLLKNIKHLYKVKNITQSEKNIDLMVTDLCLFATGKNNATNLYLKESIENYINEHYSNNNMSLSLVADKFEINTVKLSTFFKNHFYMNFTTYVEQLRIQRACTLIEENTLNFSEISEKVGYNSCQVFRRAFKRIKGISPSQYKNTL